MKVTIKAAAKINLLLDLTAILENGYHSIYTVMQSVSLYDTVTARLTGDKIVLTCSDETIPVNEKNTAHKAAQAFFESLGRSEGVKIHIDKLIPVQAGLAGGSSDAAAVIKALNILFAEPFGESELLKICEKVGADVPFCLLGGTRLCLNKGEIMARMPDMPECSIVIVKPDQGISTKKAYELYNAADWIRHPDNEGFLYAATVGDFTSLCQKTANVFEQVVEVRDRVRIKALMRGFKARVSMMTGSGSAVYGVFEDENDASECFERLSDEFKTVFLCKNTPQSLLIDISEE